MNRFRFLAPLAMAAMLVAAPAQARDFDCTLRFDLAGWSLFYKTASGTGTVSCNNGQRMAVKITTKGGGLSIGKSRIEDGTGAFAGLHDIRDALGTYVTAEAHAGAVKSSKAQVMT